MKAYDETLAAVRVIPETSAYRQNVEKLTRYRMSVVEETTDLAQMEGKLGLGRMEEVLEQAEDELQLIPEMAREKPWLGDASKIKIELID